jgi:hypothetical protein
MTYVHIIKSRVLHYILISLNLFTMQKTSIYMRILVDNLDKYVIYLITIKSE